MAHPMSLCWVRVNPAGSDQLERPEARMAVAADDDVVMHFEAKLVARLDEAASHVDIGRRRCRVARGMIVQEARLSNK